MEALCITAGVLSEVATMTQGVPYIQTLSNLITYVVSVNDDIDLLRFERGLLRDKVLHLQSMIDETERRLGPDVDLPMDFQEPFRMLEIILKQVVVVLEKCVATKGPLGNAKYLFSRKDLIKSIKHCDEELNTALKCFNTKLQAIQSLDIKDVKVYVSHYLSTIYL
ncbi:uncharacterized protein STEHIDRAFT_133136 [Stereum hirsutum FP-91666 SS1]|uniref:uncharacterized protein n=1 Tax=Stereum hirsutum (strain FP-91666) TaxID=721885 RepID=UPI0004449ADA|nr:uncharacterized protein STEHIDRAFT_133136 [Stereum hirsutum FP-91666 SS1]EIM84140.1 hypothetical protein STEHIDRAFT_133136 [Stereum hirsutum FP-91666 SS1]